MQLFYNSEIDLGASQITFDRAESKHIIKVLRKKLGDILQITDGKGNLFFVKIVIANDKKCVGQVFKKEQKPKLRNYYLHLAIAPTKNNDRFEWFLEKATEIGVDEITPIICQNSERKEIKTDRMQKIVQSAMKQSLQYRLPKLNNPIDFSSFMARDFKDKAYIAHCKKDDKKSLKAALQKGDNITILIGPEGDFSDLEIEQSSIKNFVPIALGKTRLRTETSGIVAVEQVAFELSSL